MLRSLSEERRLTLRLLVRTVLIISAMFLIAVMAASWFDDARHKREVLDTLGHRAEGVRNAIAAVMADSVKYKLERTQSLIEVVGRDPFFLRLWVVANDSTVVFAGNPDDKGKKLRMPVAQGCRDCHANAQLLREKGDQYTDETGRRRLHYIYPIRSGPICKECHDPDEERRATLVADISLDEAERAVNTTTHWLLGFVAALLLSFTVGAYKFLNRVTYRPLELVAGHLKRIAGGDFSPVPEGDRRDIIGFINHQINLTAGRLRSQYEGLEVKVEERTRSLAESQHALEEERNKLEFVFNHSPQGYVMVSTGGIVTYANSKSAKILGRRREELEGARARDVDILAQILEETDTSGRSQEPGGRKPIHRICTLVDRPRHVDVQASWVGMETGERIVLVMLNDVTEQHRLEQHLERHERLASIGRLAAGVAHEVGNPLSAISSLVQITRKLDDHEAVRKNCDLIQTHIGRIATIVRNLSNTSRVSDDNGKTADVSHIVRGAMEIASWDKRAGHVRFDLTERGGDEPYELPQDPLMQALLNIVINALDALQNADTPEVRIIVDKDDHSCEIAISDNGSGIPAGALAQIFEPFYTTKPVGTGTGLGLAVTHNVVSKMGGSIEVESREGKGTTFHIRFKREVA